MTDETMTLHDDEAANELLMGTQRRPGARVIQDEDDTPSYVLDEIDEAFASDDDEDDDFELDLSTEGPLTTDSLQLFLNEAGRYPLLTAAEEVELAKRIERGDMTAKERMITCNLRLVVSIAKRYQTQGITLGDLVQRGVANKARTIRIPVHVVEREQKVSRAERELLASLGRAATDDEVASHSKLPLAQVLEVRAAARTVASTDAPIGADGDASL